MAEYDPPGAVYGVVLDADRGRAGRRTWLAELDADRPAVVGVDRATERLDAGRERDALLPTVARFLGTRPAGTAAGLDVPFGLPAEVVAADAWPELVRQLPSWADDPPDLAREAEARASIGTDAADLRRETEEPLGALSPYSPQLRAETFYGLRDVLRPLALSGAARAAPMQSPRPDRPTLLEVYPAGTVDRLGGEPTRRPADGEADARERRATNLDAVADAGVAVEADVRERCLADDEGRALNAVVAAVAAFQHSRDPADLTTDDERRSLEGHIYV
jgi:hypothetical protein